ncbi:MAG: CBS domain-containing protein [Bdellovibrionaceae bacterium]|nr:CBS domain-containing protein [Pseudobdellovibrionaceae bacterium]
MKKTAEDVMSQDLITVLLTTPVVDAYSIMKKHDIRHLPVVDDVKKIVGMISDRDIQRCVRYDRHSQSRLLDLELNIDAEIKVYEVMSWPVEAIDASTSVRDVALTMLNSKFSSMIVECAQTSRRGIITTDDLLKLLISMLDKDPSRLRMAVGGVVYDQPSWSN